MSQKIAVIFTPKAQCSANKDNIIKLFSKKCEHLLSYFPSFFNNRKLSTCM